MRSPETRTAKVPRQDPDPARVLLVDDDPNCLLALEGVLQGMDLLTVRASSAEEALHRLAEGDTALVVLDVRMPELSGFEAAALIRRKKAIKDVPIIFVTAVDRSREDLEQAYELGAVDFLSKPVSAQALRAKVQTFVDLHRARHDLERRVLERTAALEREVAERRRAEEALAQSQRDLSDFFENGPVGCQWLGPDGRLLRINEAALRPLGYAAEELIGRSIADLHADPAAGEDLLARLSRNEVLRDRRACFRARDGRRVELVIDASVLWRDGRFVHARCFTRDVTAFLRAQEDSARLAAIVASSDDAVISKTLDGTITSWNAAAERLLGYVAEEMLGTSILRIIPEERRAEEAEILGRLRRGERVDHFETVRRRKDGTLVDLSLTVSPVKDAGGRVVGASKVARDVTEQKRAREEIRRLNTVLEQHVRERTRSLEETVQELDTFAYTVAHDLRAPLRAIHAFGEILLEEAGGALGEEHRKYVLEMVRSGARLDRLIRDLLDYSRLTRDTMRLEPVGLEEVVDRILGELRPETEELGARVEVERPLPRVRASVLLLGQALSNLLGNALKFVAPGTAPRVRLRAERLGGKVRLWVEDNGIGVAPEHHSRIFKVFERLHTRDAYPGTGIGLAIVRRAVERMGGTSGISSVAGEGSRFWIELDAAPA